MSRAALATGVLLALILAARAGWPDETRPRLALALGGGSARGLAHVGVIEVLEEHGVPIDAIAGTSMGACVGALYASGHSASEVAAIVRGIGWERIFRGRAERRQEPLLWRLDDVPAVVSVGARGRRLLAPRAALSDYSIARLLTEHLAAAGVRAGGEFDRLPTPFRAVATDLRSGARVVLARGDLPRAVRASMSLPIVFPPVELDGILLVDGALSDNVPAGVAREMGADVVVAVTVSAAPKDLDEDAGVLEVLNRLTALMMTRGADAAQPAPDVLVRPALEGIDAGDFGRYEDAIAAGRAAALQALPEILGRLQERRSRRAAPTDVDALERGVTSVLVSGRRRIDEALIHRRFGVAAGERFDLGAALRGLDSVWASNLFSSAWLEVAAEGEDGLAVTVHVRERFVTRIGLGLAYNETDNVRGFLRLRQGNLFGGGERLDVVARADSGRTELDAIFGSGALGGELLGYRVGLRVAEEKPAVYDSSGDRSGRARFRHDALSASVHRPIGSATLLGLGVTAGRSETFEEPGVPFPAHAETLVKAGARIVADTLDDRFFASSGVRLDLRADQTLSGLGASLDYGRAWGRLDAFVPFGRLGLLEAHAFGGLSHGPVPEYDLFRVGGPDLVPGRSREELWGRWAGAGSVGLGVRLSKSARLLARGGAGNAWNDQDAVSLGDLKAGASLGLILDTPVGPASIEFGVGAGQLRVHVALGFQ